MSETVHAALGRYLGENGFSTDEYTAARARLYAGPFSFSVPNPPVRQRAVPLHDIHHIATGYGTDIIGEGEIGAWELRAGCTNAFLFAVNAFAAISGCFLSPRRVIRAFRSARGAKTMYVRGLGAADVRDLSVVELRAALGVPIGGVANPCERKLHGGHAATPAQTA